MAPKTPPRDTTVASKQEVVSSLKQKEQSQSHKDITGIEVGTAPEMQIFNVHTCFLTPRSLFFKKALSGEWKEATEHVVRFPEDHPKIFAAYLHLVYTGELAVEPEKMSDIYSGGEVQQTLANLYILAEKLQDIGSKNAVLQSLANESCLIRQSGESYLPGWNVINIIYEGTVTGSLARKLMVDLYAYNSDEGTFKNGGDILSKYHNDFILEFAVGLLQTHDRPKSPHSMKETGFPAYMEKLPDQD